MDRRGEAKQRRHPKEATPKAVCPFGSYTVNSTDAAFAYNWQWSAAVFTYWPVTDANRPDTGNNGAQIQPYHGGSGGYHAGTPLNTTVQQSLIQGPRGGGGANFTGSWSATASASCVGNPYP
jgi:hypothetical protein